MAKNKHSIFPFFPEGVLIVLGKATDGKDYEAKRKNIDPSCQGQLFDQIRRIVNIGIYEKGTRTKLVGNYPGEVTLVVGFQAGESGYNVYLWDDQCQLLKTYQNGDPDFKVHFKALGQYSGYFEIEDDSFPDPNIGVGP